MTDSIRGQAIQRVYQEQTEQIKSARLAIEKDSFYTENPGLQSHLVELKHALNQNNPEQALRVTRQILSQSNGGQVARMLLGNNEPTSIAYKVVSVALGHDIELPNERAPISGESWLHLACQGKKPVMIKKAAIGLKPAEFFKKSGPDNKSPVDYLHENAVPTQLVEAYKAIFDCCITSNDPKTLVEVARKLSKLPGSKEHIRANLSKITDATSKAALAALSGSDFNLDSVNTKVNYGTRTAERTLLHLACEGGDSKIIDQVSTAMRMSILDEPLFSRAAMEDLSPEGYPALIDALSKVDHDKQVETLRKFLSLPDRKQALSNLLDKEYSNKQKNNTSIPVLSQEQRAIYGMIAALLGDNVNFNLICPQNLEPPEHLLSLACEGGDPAIIWQIASNAKDNENPFLKRHPAWVGKRVIDMIDPSILDVKFTLPDGNESDLRALYNQHFAKKGKTIEQELHQLNIPSPLKAVTKAAKVAKNSLERRARLGSGSAKGERLSADPDRREAFYGEKLALYDSIKVLQGPLNRQLGVLNFKRALAAVPNNRELENYLKANTFHFLGGLIEAGEFELAKSMVAKGLFNEVSPRLLSMLNTSPLSNEQQLELCGLFLNHADKETGFENQVLAIQYMLGIPGGRDKAKAWFAGVSDASRGTTGLEAYAVISALLGDKDKLNAILNDTHKDRLLKLKTPDGKTLMHYACMGNDPETIKAFADWHSNNAAKEAANPFLVKDAPLGIAGALLGTKSRPIDLMSRETALALDLEYEIDPNQAGSFSNATAYVQYVRTPMKTSAMLGTVMAGKFLGDIAATAVGFNLSPGDIGQKSLPGGNLPGSEMVFLNGPMFGGIAATTGTTFFLRRKWRELKAENRGLDCRLSQWKPKSTEPTKPTVHRYVAELQNAQDPQITETVIRRLARVPDITPMDRSDLLTSLITQSKDEFNKPEDGNKMVESLLESQIEQGPYVYEPVKTAIRHHLKDAKNPPSMGKLRSYMLAATRMGDMVLLNQIAAKSNEPDSLWLDTFVRRKPNSPFGLPKLDRGNTLMHVAAAAGNVEFIGEVADKLTLAYEQRARVTPAGEPVTYRQATGTKVQRLASAFGPEGGRLRGLLTHNPFDIKNAAGQSAAEMLSLPVARALDAKYELDSSQPGSFTAIARERVQVEEELLGAGLGMVMPAKLGLNFFMAKHVANGIVLAMHVGAAVHAGPVGVLLAGAVGDLIAGTGVMIVGSAIGFLSGQAAMSAVTDLERKLRGYGLEASQFDIRALQTAKADLRKLCGGLVDKDILNEAFNIEVKNRGDLSRILAQLSYPQTLSRESSEQGLTGSDSSGRTTPESSSAVDKNNFAQKFADRMSRIALVQSGRISQRFSDALEKGKFVDSVSQDVKKFAADNSLDRKKALNGKLENKALCLEIDRYLDAGMNLSDNEQKRLALAFSQ